MALVCPVNHPPGVGTTFCRLCGRAYLEVPDPEAVATLPPPVVEAPAIPQQATPQGQDKAQDEGQAKAQVTAQDKAQAAPAAPPIALPPALADAPTEVLPFVLPVSAPHGVQHGVQVHLPLRQVAPAPAPAREEEAEAAAPEQEPEPVDAEPSRVRRELDRAALLTGLAGGFVGGALSGGAVAYLLT